MPTSDSQQESNKRQKPSPASEQELAEDSVDITNIDDERSRPTTPSGSMQEPSTSQTYMLVRKHSVEVSSFRMPADKDQDIKERYKEIKARNERLKAQTYAQYLKMTPINQIRLIQPLISKRGNTYDFHQSNHSVAKSSIRFQKGGFRSTGKGYPSH